MEGSIHNPDAHQLLHQEQVLINKHANESATKIHVMKSLARSAPQR